MAWDHLSITRPHLVYIILGGFTSLFMLCSSIIKERFYIGEATVATLCGIIFGPHAANLINPLDWGNVDIVTIEFSRIVLVVQCFAVGVELPKFYMERHWKSVIYLLGPVMTFGWLITSVFIYWMVPALNWLDSLVVAACVTATDPVLASSVVGKGKFAKRIPKHLRDLLSAESGCNDGMAFPFVYLALYLISEHLDARHTIKHWVLYTILYECVFGCILGFAIGYIARHAIKFAETREYIDRESFLVFYFVLSLFSAGVGSMLGVDDLLVGFAAGVGFSNDGWFSEKTEESHVSDVIDLLLNLTYFVYFGTIIPWSDFNDAAIGLQAWRLVVIAVFVIFFRRIPAMLAFKPLISDIKTWREALFAGHFGPMGVGAIFVALLARAELESGNAVPLAKLPPPDSPNYTLIRLIWPIVTFIVISSIIVHGSSIAVFALGKRINTLKVTMSYTVGPEEGAGGWMNRLPRLSSQSKSQMKTMSDTEGDMDMPEFPPGTLPPIGMPNHFLRRQREEEGSSRAASRASSRVSRRRRKRKDEAGGPVEMSAIFPEKRPSDAATTSPDAADEQPATSALEKEAGAGAGAGSGSRPSSSDVAAEKQPEVLTAPPVTVYEQGSKILFENQEGEVLGVTDEQSEREAKPAPEEVSEEAGPPPQFEWSLDYMKRKFGDVYSKEMDKRKQKADLERKHEPAQAYQFGNTVIVEDVDGEVIKTYELPSDKPEGQGPDLMSQGLRYIGLSKVTGRKDGEGASSSPQPTGEGSGAAESAAGAGAKKPDVDKDDRHIRFTINGEGRRLTKADFCKEMQKLDARTRREVVAKSSASPALKKLATQDRADENVARMAPAITTTVPTDSSRGASAHGARPAAAGASTTAGAVDDDETPAERRRREAALGMGGQEDDSDEEEDGQRGRRGIRFAD